MAHFVAQVPLRWIDQDSYRHLNHARAVTLLEEARIALFFDRATADGVGGFSDGLLAAGLGLDYRRQVAYRSHTLRVAMTVDEVRAASFVIHYALHDGPGGGRAGGDRRAHPDGYLRPRRATAAAAHRRRAGVAGGVVRVSTADARPPGEAPR